MTPLRTSGGARAPNNVFPQQTVGVVSTVMNNSESGGVSIGMDVHSCH